MDAAFMQLERHERGIHIECGAGAGAGAGAAVAYAEMEVAHRAV